MTSTGQARSARTRRMKSVLSAAGAPARRVVGMGDTSTVYGDDLDAMMSALISEFSTEIADIHTSAYAGYVWITWKA